MLEGAKFWTKGYIDLLDPDDKKLKKFYISEASIPNSYNHIQERIKTQGSIPIGIDHIPEFVLNQFPILKKMDVLHVGDITDVELIDNALYIKKADIFNPTIQKLYEAGELTDLSMRGYMKKEPCNQDPDVMYVLDNDIVRVDIVGKGACESCTIPPPNSINNDEGSVNASKVKIPIKILEANKMTEPNIKPNEPQEPETNEEEVSTLGKLIKQLEGIVKMLKKEDNEENNEQEEAAGQPLSVNNVVPAPTGASSADAVMASKVEQLEKEIETYKKAQASAYVEQLVSAGKVAPVNKEHYVKLAEADMESVQAIMASAPVQFSMSQESLQANASQPFTENVDLDDPENIISSFEALDKED